MSAVILSYGAKLVREDRMSGSDMLSFIMCQLALGPILSVSVYLIHVYEIRIFFLGYITNLFISKNSCRCQ